MLPGSNDSIFTGFFQKNFRRWHAYDKAEAEYESLYRKMSLLEEEAVKALDGTSKFDTDTISSMIAKCRS